jgi:transcriptional regulator with XRE-family HTH domain
MFWVHTKQKPLFLRRRLGRRLRALRESAGLSMDEAAARLEMSRTSLFRVESGEYKANVHLIRSMMDLYDSYVEDLLDQAREALKPRWYHQCSSADMGYVDVETEAVMVREFSGLNLPGLLQTEPYMRAVFARHPLHRTAKKLEDDVAVRRIRQRRLTNDDEPLELVAIVDEAALRRRVGSVDVMRGQLEHLVESAELPTVTLQVLPLRDGAHSATDGAFILLTFPEDYNPEMLYVEYITGALHIEDAKQVRACNMVFDRLRTEALGPADSVALIEQVRVELDD